MSAKSSELTKEEYQAEITNLKAEIEALEKEYDDAIEKFNLLAQEYAQLDKEFSSMLSKEKMFEWLNVCNIYNVRANMKIVAKHYNTFLGFETTSESYHGSGFIFCSSGSTKYVLTTYFLTEDQGYDKISYTLYDAFQFEYSATLYKSSKTYGLAVLKFTDSNENDLYTVPLATKNPEIDDPVCNIYSLQKSAYNHMNFSKIISYEKTSYFNFDVFKNEIDTKSAIYGAMCVDLKGNVIGLVSLTNTLDGSNYCKNIPVEKIREYLSSIGFKLN